MRRVLVTGATGFLGRHLCHALIQRNDFAVALRRDMGAGFTASVIVDGGYDQIERAIAEYEIDTVVHLAAQTQVSTAVKDPIGTLEANVRGTWQVMEACRRQNVKRVIVASSDKAYGDWIVPYTEAQPLVPGGVYATSKLMGDVVAQAYANEYRMSVAITRCGNLYGPGHLNFSTLIPGTIKSVLHGERPVLRSDGRPKRDFLFVEDAVDGYLRLIDSDVAGPYNFGTMAEHRVIDIVALILQLMKSDLRPDVKLSSTAMEIKDQLIDWTKAREVLGWEPKHSLAEGLKKTIHWYRQHFNIWGDDAQFHCAKGHPMTSSPMTMSCMTCMVESFGPGSMFGEARRK